MRKCVCVLSIISTVNLGGSVALGARLAGVHPLTGWRWHRAYQLAGVNGLVPLTHRSGRKAVSPAPRADGIFLPVQISLRDVRFRNGRVHFTAALRPVLNSRARREARRTVSKLERSLPKGIRQIFNPSK